MLFWNFICSGNFLIVNKKLYKIQKLYLYLHLQILFLQLNPNPHNPKPFLQSMTIVDVMNLVQKTKLVMPKENVIANVMYVVKNVMNVVVDFMDLPKKWIIAMVYKYIYIQNISFHCKVVKSSLKIFEFFFHTL